MYQAGGRHAEGGVVNHEGRPKVIDTLNPAGASAISRYRVKEEK